jgi:hypothetical protein
MQPFMALAGQAMTRESYASGTGCPRLWAMPRANAVTREPIAFCSGASNSGGIQPGYPSCMIIQM